MTDVEHTTRQVIEDKLLTALSDDEKVAIVCTKSDIETLESALGYGIASTGSDDEASAFQRFLTDIQLLKAGMP